ncbi:hypothetical protein [Streptomyces exfoliatus]|uniref:hypothetical protein n=1 Tax=Streptomyces TaxID=1883 RepID=UPI00069077B9|nr:hypothetical protein [Streptomyces exfoliatus]
MTLNARWQGLFEDTAPSGPSERPAAMTLAGTTAGDGGASGSGGTDLKADVGPWHQAGNASGELRVSTGTSLTDLERGNEGVAGGTAGFDSSAALTEILGTWKARLTSVRDECGRLEGALKSAGRDFGEREADTQRRIAAGAPAPSRTKEG